MVNTIIPLDDECTSIDIKDIPALADKNLLIVLSKALRQDTRFNQKNEACKQFGIAAWNEVDKRLARCHDVVPVASPKRARRS